MEELKTCPHTKIQITISRSLMECFIYDGENITNLVAIVGGFSYPFYVVCQNCGKGWHDDTAPKSIRDTVQKAKEMRLNV